MNKEQQIKAIAELDGWTDVTVYPDENKVDGFEPNNQMFWKKVPPYLTSRDAIVPVIERQPRQIQIDFVKWLHRAARTDSTILTDVYCILATPAQLCEALLRATGNWDL